MGESEGVLGASPFFRGGRLFFLEFQRIGGSAVFSKLADGEPPRENTVLKRPQRTSTGNLLLLVLAFLATAGTAWAEGRTAPAHTYLKTFDWTVIAIYGVGLLGIGYYFARRTRTAEDYLLGGRTMRSSSVGLSLFASLLSTITYLALPGEMVNKGPVILWNMVSIPIAYVVVGYWLIPHFMKLRVTSAYEILQARLGMRIRLLGSSMFLLTRLLWMALIIYITADKIIVVMMGWDPSVTPYVAIAIGLVTVVYTSMGGLRAVVFTDVVQSFILFGGAVLAIILISVKMGGVTAWWPTEWSPTWDAQPVFSWDLNVRATLVGSIVFMTVWWICTAGSDQMAIQRYLATRDVKAARRVFLVTGLANIVVTSCLAILGFALLGFYRANPQMLDPGMTVVTDADRLFPHYIVKFLPPGITGLVIAGLLAAAMSSLSSGINSSCSVISVDFVDRMRKPGAVRSDRSQVLQTKAISWIVGLIAVALSSMMGRVTGNIMEVTVRTNHVFVAPLFGLFFMALFVKRATPFGTAMGALAGCVVAILFAYWDLITKALVYVGLFEVASEPLTFQYISLFSLVANLAVAIPLSYLTYTDYEARKLARIYQDKPPTES